MTRPRAQGPSAQTRIPRDSARPSAARRRGTALSGARRARPARRGPRRARYPLGVTLRTALSRRRRLLAAVLLSAAAALAVLQLSPGSQQTVPTVVAARALGAGTVLSPEDLRVVDYPASLVPAGGAGQERASPEATSDPAASPETLGTRAEAVDGTGAEGDPTAAWIGRTLAAAVVEGQPLTGPSVLGPDLLSGQPPGTTAVTVRVADAAALTHVRPGQHVDLIRAVDRADIGGQRNADDDRDGPGSEEAGPGDEGSGGSQRIGAQLPVLWVADPAAPAQGLLETAPQDQGDLLVVGADAATAERIAAAPEGELVPVLVAAPAPPSSAPAPSAGPAAEPALSPSAGAAES